MRAQGLPVAMISRENVGRNQQGITMQPKNRMCKTACYWLLLGYLGLTLGLSRAVAAQDIKGCETVGFAKKRALGYSPEELKRRLEHDPRDTDALLNLGLHLEERGQLQEAYSLHRKAIETAPNCYLGYLFAGMAAERIGREAQEEAERAVRMALSLNPDIQGDPNVQGFIHRHPALRARSERDADPESESFSLPSLILRQPFLIGIGVGILIAAPLVYFARRRKVS